MLALKGLLKIRTFCTKPRGTRVKHSLWHIDTGHMVPLSTLGTLYQALVHLRHPTGAVHREFLCTSNHSSSSNKRKHLHLSFLQALPEMSSHFLLIELKLSWMHTHCKCSSKRNGKEATVAYTSLNWYINEVERNF